MLFFYELLETLDGWISSVDSLLAVQHSALTPLAQDPRETPGPDGHEGAPLLSGDSV